MKFLKLNPSSLFWQLSLVVLATIPLFFLMLRPGFFPMQDDLQAFRQFEMDRCFQDLQIPCRWVPDMGYQYGYPQFEFYPPSVFYLGEIFHLIGFQFIDVIKILFILGFIFSGLSMYILLKEFFTKLAAFVGTILYLYTPFRATQVYVRGSLNEFFSFVFFPLIFWSSFKLIQERKIKYLCFFALSVGGLLLTHNLMSMLFLPVALVWIISWLVLLRAKRAILLVLGGGVLALGLAAFFILPLFFERSLVHLESLVGGYFDYRQHFVTVFELFISNHFGYGSSVLGPIDDLSLSTGIIQWVLALLGVVILFIKRKQHRHLMIISLSLVFVELGVLFMSHQRSSFIWSSLPFLVWLQFPWRFLEISVFLLAFLSGLVIFLIQSKFTKVIAILTIAVTIFLYGGNFKPREWLNISDKEKFSGQSWEKQLTISIFDYLPIYAKLPPNKIAPELPEVLEGQASFTRYQKGSNFQKGEVIASTSTLIRVPLFDYPGMAVYLNGQKIAHHHDDCRLQEYCLGLITFKIPKGTHKLEVKLTDTPLRQAANLASILSILALVGLIFTQGVKNVKR